MRIAVYLYNLNGGGAEKVMISFLNYIYLYSSIKPLLIVSEFAGPYIDLINPNIEVVDLNRKSVLKSSIPLFQYLKENRVDVIYSTLRRTNLVAILIGKILGIFVVIREASTISENKLIHKDIKNRLTLLSIKYFYSFADKCIAISGSVKNDLVKHTFIDEDKVNIIYNPIMLRDELKDIVLDPSFFHIGFVSRLTPVKNIETIVKIIENYIHNNNFNIKFHFFGEGECQSLISNLVSKSENKEIVELHGFNLSYYSYVKHMNLFIHIPLWEGLGNSVLEVYNTGIPLILSDIDAGYKELVNKDASAVHYVHPTNDLDLIISIINHYYNMQGKQYPKRSHLGLSESEIFQSYLKLIN